MSAHNSGLAPSATTPVLRHRRPSTTESIISAAKKVEAKIEQALLLIWDDLPNWRQDNHFILSGYRAQSNSYRKCFKSLFYVHNEFVNIWSHLLGAFIFPSIGVWLHRIIAPRYGSANGGDILVFSCFFVGAVLCLGMSATYHTVLNHSYEVNKWGNKLDYTGIVLLIVGSYVPALYYGLYCMPRWMTVYMIGIFVLGFGCGVVCWAEKFRSPRFRAFRSMMFVGLGLSGIIPVCHGLTIYGYKALEERMGLNWVMLQGFLYIFGAFLYAARWPERTSPGRFDIWGSSHQIFHILVLCAAASHLTGMAKAFDYRHTIVGNRC